MVRINARQALDSTLIPLSKEEVSGLNARMLQVRTINWLRRLNPANEREFYRNLLYITWSVRDELSKNDPGILREFVARLVRKIETSCNSLRERDPDGLKLALADTDARIWKLRMLDAGEDQTELESLLVLLSRREGRIFKKLRHGDPTQLDLRLTE